MMARKSQPGIKGGRWAVKIRRLSDSSTEHSEGIEEAAL
jgi:hypothetical protein